MKWTMPLIVALALSTGATACDNDPAEGKVKAKVAESVQTPPAPAAAAKYVFSNEGSSLEFVGAKVTNKHEGRFDRFSGHVDLVDGSPEKSSVTVEVQTACVAIEPEKLKRHLKSDDFFDVEKHPKATFQSTAIKNGGEGGASYTVTGNLALHGVTRSITFPATIKVDGDQVLVDSEFAINRKDFHIVYPGMPDDLIKDDVLIRLKLAARKG